MRMPALLNSSCRPLWCPNLECEIYQTDPNLKILWKYKCITTFYNMWCSVNLIACGLAENLRRYRAENMTFDATQSTLSKVPILKNCKSRNLQFWQIFFIKTEVRNQLEHCHDMYTMPSKINWCHYDSLQYDIILYATGAEHGPEFW